MRSDPEAIIAGLLSAWRLQDIDATLAYCDPHIRYRVHQPVNVTGFGGETMGIDEVRDYMEAVCHRWTFLDLKPTACIVLGPVVRNQTYFRSIHRRSGQIVDGIKRHIWRVDNGRVAECDEYHDAAGLAAFVRMAESTVT